MHSSSALVSSQPARLARHAGGQGARMVAPRVPCVPNVARAPRFARAPESIKTRATDRATVDPVSESLSTEAHVPGQIWTVHSSAQLQAAVEKHAQQLTVLMCKSKTCRPCKAFLKKYMAIAQQFPDAVLLQISGDESPDTRKLMMSMKVKVTPTFALYRGGSQIATSTGVSETKLLRAIVDALTPEERAAHIEDIGELEAAEAEEAAAEKQ
ncbi:MAG: hypothetical protein J3K34DRAFT_436614 [Monoraphidium minutum]|nr:MAG: hypothetical protein J3K34DRAFT_436614 [Monoraphidium minutum]